MAESPEVELSAMRLSIKKKPKPSKSPPSYWDMTAAVYPMLQANAIFICAGTCNISFNFCNRTGEIKCSAG